MKKLCVLVIQLTFVCLFLQISVTFAQKVNIPLDGRRVFKTVSFLSSDQFLGRKANTPEFFKLQDWIIEQFQKWDMEPAGENSTFYQAVPISRDYAVNYGTPELIIDKREFFTRYGDFSIDSRSTPGIKINKNVVFAGYGISAADKGLDEYAGLKVQGKIVFVLKGDPNEFTPQPPRMSSPRNTETEQPGDEYETWEIESLDSTKIMVAYHRGAAAIILYDPDSDANLSRRNRPQIKKSPFERDFIIVSDVSEHIFHWLLWRDPQMTSRGFRTWINNVRGDIKKKKTASFDTEIKAKVTGYKQTLRKGEEFNDYNGRSIIAKITGTDPILKNQFVVVGAHLDHVGVSNGQIYNGADDNASGSGVVIELAQLMKEHQIRTKRTVLFCLWSAEELGLIGSRHWVENPSDSMKVDQIIAYFNLDMVGIGEELDAPGALNFPPIWKIIKRDQDQDITDMIKPREGGPGGSDHSAFIELGIESLALMTGGEGGHPDYHDTGDDGYKIHPEVLRKTSKFVLQGIINLANDTTEQLIIPERQHLYNAMRWTLKVINPDLGIENSWSTLNAKTIKDLSELMKNEVQELKELQPARAMRRRSGNITRNMGLQGLEAFNQNIYLMELSKEILNFGRLDIHGDDGIWFNQGLTKQGAVALEAMETNEIALHLIEPTQATLLAVLDKSEQPFLVSGYSDYDDSLITKIKNNKVLLGVDFDPENLEACVTQLEMFKTKFGNADNLLLNVISNTDLEVKKRELYQHLIKKGWDKEEIYAIGGAGISRRSNGNLDVLPGGRPPTPNNP
jgi:hypothetical protein